MHLFASKDTRRISCDIKCEEWGIMLRMYNKHMMLQFSFLPFGIARSLSDQLINTIIVIEI